VLPTYENGTSLNSMPLPNDTHPKLAAYAHPERLVTTEWLAEHLDHPA
jgi:thiosulfate/3-mercaptopyruvate sulfurtransferase